MHTSSQNHLLLASLHTTSLHIMAAVQEGLGTFMTVDDVRSSSFTFVAKFIIPHAIHTALPQVTRVLSS